VGAFIGRLLVELLSGNGFSFEFNLVSFLVAAVGVVVLLAIVGLIRRNYRSSPSCDTKGNVFTRPLTVALAITPGHHRVDSLHTTGYNDHPIVAVA
jgi:hypothetical protein